MDLVLRSQTQKDYFSKSRYIKELKPTDFDEIETYKLQAFVPKSNFTFVMFYAPWCKYCKETKEMWEILSTVSKEIGFSTIASMNCEKFKVHAMKMNMDYRHRHKNPLILTYPTLVLYKDSVPFKTFKQQRTIDNLLNFCIKNCKK